MAFRRTERFFVALLVVLSAALLGAGCGGDDEGSESAAREVDGAFLVEMAAHHESAIEMAELAQESGRHRELRGLADAIVTSQSDEIERMEQIHAALFTDSLGETDHGSLGLAEHETGMEHGAADLEGADPFDRAFIDSMVPHHQGAIRMARLVLESGSDPQVATLANEIIKTQSREIEDMNAWREEWYGDSSPAGGVPEASASEDDAHAAPHEEMGH